MTTNPNTAPDKATATSETGTGLPNTRQALEGAKAEVGILSAAGNQLKNLARDYRDLNSSERLKRVGGLVALATLGWILKKEDVEHYEEGDEEIDEEETLDDTPVEQANKKARKKPDASGKNLSQQAADPREDEVISAQQAAVNMYAIRYFEADGSKHASPNSLGKILIAEKVTPSKFILEKSGALFKEGVGSLDDFKKNLTDKLVDKSVTDPKERIRQAAVILSCCAVGRFQIVPHFFFEKMGLKTRGEEGLKDMYNYIRSTDRQIGVFKKIIEGQWNSFKDVGLVAVAYYAGDATASAYKQNPEDPRFQQKQYGGHASINEYAQKARANFAKFKSEIPGLQEIDYVAMVIESNETGKGVIYARAKQGQGISGTKAPTT